MKTAHKAYYATLLTLIALGLASPSWAEAAEGRGAREKATDHYRVIDGKVDKSTMLGWRVFHSACFECHGVGAVGTDVAPDLTQRIKRLSPTEFAMSVLSRYRILVPYREGLPDDQAELAAIVEEMKKRQRGTHGQIMMPAWDSDPRIKPHIMDLYAYLRARADGALGPGHPEPIDDKTD
jgi:hypothetical protein